MSTDIKDDVDAVVLDATVDRVTFYNPENGFSVVKARVRGRRDPVAVVGTLPAVQPGEVLHLTGEWRTDPRHGAQFSPSSASVSPPSDAESIVRYLGSGLIRQLGPVLAQRIVAAFGDRTLAILDATPERVREVPGVGSGRATALAAAWSEHRALRAVTAYLSEHHLDTRYAPRLVAAYGADAPRVLSANPYRLVADVPGLGFAAADALGQSLSIRPAATARLQAAIHAAMLRASEQGHTRLTRDALTEQAAALAGVDTALADPAVTQLLSGGILATTTPRTEPDTAPPGSLFESVTPYPASASVKRGRLRIYEPPSVPAAPPVDAGPSLAIGLAGLVRTEEALAADIRTLAARRSRNSPAAVDAWLLADEHARALSSEQRAAVRAALLSCCFVLTGGPGVGKTTTVRVLVRCLQALGHAVALAAPTGKAAKRLEEVVGLEAKTLHRLLGSTPQGFRHGRRDPLPFDTVIVDEASMLDTHLARAVTAALGRHAQLILVGDADQLPSVGPGQVLRDLLNSQRVPSVRLDTVFRQAARSQIVTNAHRIRQGQMPELVPFTELGEQHDCVFVPAPPERAAEYAAHWAAVRLPQLFGLSSGDVQVLAPLNRVCQSINSQLQMRLNPPKGQAERPHGALPLRAGDRVIQTRNNYHLGVFNGDTGTITSVEPEGLCVDFGDGAIIAYAPADLLDLDHAYCLTVHRAQGSEWPAIVLVASASSGATLSRNLLYTALTRARRVAVIVGDEATVARAVADMRDQERSTGLAALLASGGEMRAASDS